MNSFNANLPIYLQVVDMMKTKILSGILEPGDKLPSVRELAVELGVNPNTIQRAFLELERDGFIRTERAVGRYVAENTELIRDYKNQQIQESMKTFLEHMESLGLTKEDVIVYLKEGVFDG